MDSDVQGNGEVLSTDNRNSVVSDVGNLFRSVREDILKQHREAFARTVGISTTALRSVEMGTAKERIYTRVLHYWKTQNANLQPRQQRTVERTKEKVLDGLVAREGLRTFAYLRRLMLEAGFEAFEKRTGVKVSTVSKRRQEKTVTPAYQLIEAAQALGVVESDLPPAELAQHPAIARARDAWRKDAMMVLRWPSLTARLLAWVGSTGRPTNEATLIEHFGLLQREARALAKGTMVSAKAVRRILNALRSAGSIPAREADEILAAWAAWEKREGQKDVRSFQGQLDEAFERQGMTNEFLSKVLRIRERSPNIRRPSDPVRDARNGGFTPLVSPFSLAAVASASAEELRQLTEMHQRDLRDQLRRKQSKLHPVYLDRMLYGVELKDLVDIFPEEQIRRLENHRPSKITSDESLRIAIRRVGERQVQDAIAEWLCLHDFPSVRTAVERLVETEGLVPIARAAHVRPDALESIVRGRYVPSLCTLASMLRAGRRTLTPQLECDWRLQRGQKARKDKLPPYARALEVYMGSLARTPGEIFRDRLSSTYMSRVGWPLLCRGQEADAAEVNRLLGALKIVRNSPLGAFLDALRTRRSYGKAMKAWSEEMLSQKQFDILLGLRDLQQMVMKTQSKALKKDDQSKLPPLSALLEQKFAVMQRSAEGWQPDEKDKRMLTAIRSIPGTTVAELLAWDGTQLDVPSPTVSDHPPSAPITQGPKALAKRALDQAYDDADPFFKANWDHWSRRVLRDAALDELMLHPRNVPRAVCAIQQRMGEILERRERYHKNLFNHSPQRAH